MKGGITLKILEAIAEFSGDAIDHIEAFLSAGYGASIAGQRHALARIHSARAEREFQKEKEIKLSKRTTDFLFRLKRDKLIIETTKNGRKTFKLTKEGISKLLELGRRQKRIGHMPDFNKYSKNSGPVLIVAIFDIPESKRECRAWLRLVFRKLGLKMLQHSVWIGRIKIPTDLALDLKELEIVDCIEIFAITKTGSLSRVV